ncbi:MAG: TonB-dependent receptor domain-containing protein [Muribaculaceae bacterium]
MKKRITLMLVCIIATLCFGAEVASAQTSVSYSVRGVLVDSVSGESEPFATVRVFDMAKPSTQPVKVDVTDADGKFNVSLKGVGKYLASFSVVGKVPAMRTFEIDAAHTSVDLGKVATKAADNALGELLVEASRPLIKADVDKITYDMEADPDAKTNTITEMLRKVPMVTVDGEDNIQVNGSSSFKVLVNGKPNTMMTNNPKEVFRSMPANIIKKIEVITDPGAKYDAEGVGGVLNIITTDAKVQGYNATVNGNLDTRQSGGGFFATAQSGKFTVSANVNYSHQFKRKINSENSREDFTSEEFRTLNMLSTGKNWGDFMFGSLEASYEVDSLNLITMSGNIFNGKFKTSSINDTEMLRRSGDRRYAYRQNSLADNTFGGNNLGLDYQHSFKKKGELLTLSYRLDFSPASSGNDTRYDDVQDVPYDLYDQRFDNDAHTEEHTVQADYVNPLTDVHYIDFGAKYIYRKNKSEVDKWIANQAGEMVEDDSPDNRYSQLRNIVAAYADYQLKYKGFGLKAGARYEYTYMNVKYDFSPDRNYSASMNDVVPSVKLSYMLKPTTTLKMSYTMRINRPGISSLNPYVDDSNPNTISYGNPDLDTEKSHTISAGYSQFGQKLMINLNANYNFSDNGIEQYSTIKDGVMTTTYGNVVRRRSVGGDLWCNYTPWAKTRIMVSLRLNYNDYKSDALNQHSSGFALNAFTSIQQTLPYDFNVSVYYGGNSKQKSLQSTMTSMTFHGFSLSKSFLKDKALTLSLRANSPFKNYLKFNSNMDSETFSQKSNIRVPMRSFGVSLSWRFGSLKASVKKTSRSINNDDVTKDNSSNSGAGVGTSVGNNVGM